VRHGTLAGPERSQDVPDQTASQPSTTPTLLPPSANGTAPAPPAGRPTAPAAAHPDQHRAHRADRRRCRAHRPADLHHPEHARRADQLLGAHASLSLAFALLLAAIAGALLMAAVGTARITQLRLGMRRDRRRGGTQARPHPAREHRPGSQRHDIAAERFSAPQQRCARADRPGRRSCQISHRDAAAARCDAACGRGRRAVRRCDLPQVRGMHRRSPARAARAGLRAARLRLPQPP
jgi:hypothetical protein